MTRKHHSADHSTYKRWKYAFSTSLGWTGLLSFVLGFLWLARNLFPTRAIFLLADPKSKTPDYLLSPSARDSDVRVCARALQCVGRG